MHICSLQFAADHMGLSSLNDYRRVVRSLYDPQAIVKYCNPDIVLLLSPTPTAQELNIYMVEMSERNGIPLEEINIIGHKFTKDWSQPGVELDQHLLEIKQKIGEEMAKNIGQGHGQGQGGEFPYGGQGQGGYQPGPGGQGFSGGQGGYGGGPGGYNLPPNQGGYMPQPPNQGPYQPQ